MDEFHLGPSKPILRGLQALPGIFFGLFYHRFVGVYDFITRIFSMGLWKTWLSITQSYLKGPAILELGFGPGHLQKLLGESGDEVVGLDESKQMVALAKKRLEMAGLRPSLVRAVGEAIPFRNSAFDQVVTTFPAEFITEASTLGDIHRVLKENGDLIVLRFAWLSDRQWPYKLTTWLYRLVGEAPGADQPLQEERLSKPFQNAGFTVEIEQVDLGSSSMILMLCKKQKNASSLFEVS